MRNAGDQTNENQHPSGSPAAAANVDHSAQNRQPANGQHSEVHSALPGALAARQAKFSPSIAEDTAPGLPASCPADLSSARHTDQHAIPQSDHAHLGSGRNDLSKTQHATADPAKRLASLSVPPVGLSSAHQHTASCLPPPPPDDATAISETMSPAIHRTGGPDAHVISPGQLTAVASPVTSQGHDAFVRQMPTAEHAHVAGPAAAAGTSVAAISDSLLPVPLQQRIPADSPVMPMASVIHSPTSSPAPDHPSADVQQQLLVRLAAISKHLSLTAGPPQQQATASSVSAAPFTSATPAAPAPGIKQHQQGPAARLPGKQSDEPGARQRDSHTHTPLGSNADPELPQDPSWSLSMQPLEQQVANAAAPDQGSWGDAQRPPCARFPPEVHGMCGQAHKLPSRSIESLFDSLKEWFAEQTPAGLLAAGDGTVADHEQLVSQASSPTAARRVPAAANHELSHPSQAKQALPVHLVKTAPVTTTRPALDASLQAALQHEFHARIAATGLQFPPHGTNSGNPGPRSASIPAPADNHERVQPSQAKQALPVPPAAPVLITQPPLDLNLRAALQRELYASMAATGLEPWVSLHGTNAEAASASRKAPADNQSSTSPRSSHRHRNPGNSLAGSASDKAPAQGQADTTPADPLLGGDMGGTAVDTLAQLAQDQASPAPVVHLHRKDAGNLKAGSASGKAPALHQASSAPTTRLHAKSDNPGDEDASDKAPAQGQASAASMEPPDDKNAGSLGPGATSDQVPAHGQESTGPVPGTDSFADFSSKPEPASRGLVERDKVGKTGCILKANLPRPAEASRDCRVSPEGMILIISSSDGPGEAL